MIRISIILLLLCLGTALQAQNLDKMDEAKRRETLLKIAKATVMEYGPSFYREYGQPEIIHNYVNKNNQISIKYFHEEQLLTYKNRSYYTVKYFYDKTVEAFPENHAALVFIWGDTGEAFKIFFGSSNVGYNLTKESRALLKKNRNVQWQKRPSGAFDPPKRERIDVEYIPKKKETKDTSERK